VRAAGARLDARNPVALDMARMSPDEFNAILEQRRARYLERLGDVSDHVVSRVHPLGGSLWPASALGRMRIVRRERSRLVATDGLSCPFDAGLHPAPPPGPLDFELCIDVHDLDPRAVSDESLATSWFPSLLYSLTDWIVPEWFDLRGALRTFRAVTLSAPATTDESRRLADGDGHVGFLVGLPLAGRDLDLHPYLSDYYDGTDEPYAGAALGYFPVKPLTPDEYAWAKARGDEGGVLLAQKFLDRRDAHFAWTERPSVLTTPRL
jgi:hypothetical protein